MGVTAGLDGAARGSETTRFAAAATRFQRVTVAYLVLKDTERARVYDEHGYGALVKSESYLEDDVFDADPWDVYERFFKGEDEEDREYLLLNGGDDVSEEEEEEEEEELGRGGWGKGKGKGAEEDDASSDDDEDDEEEDEAFLQEALATARHKRFESGETGAGRTGGGQEAPPPRPPVSVLMAMEGGPGGMGFGPEDNDRLPGLGGGDVWAALARRYEVQPEAGAKDAGDGNSEENEEEEEDDDDDDDDEESEEEDEDDDSGDNDEEEDEDCLPEEVGVKRKREEEGEDDDNEEMGEEDDD